MRRIREYFILCGVDVYSEDYQDLFEFLSHRFEKQGRFKHGEKFRITSQFVLDGVAAYINKNHSSGGEFFQSRSSVRIREIEDAPQYKHCQPPRKYLNLIKCLGKKHTSHFNLTTKNNERLSPEQIDKMRPFIESYDVGLSPVKPIRSHAARDRALSMNSHRMLEKMISNSEISCWREKTPTKKISPITHFFSEEKNPDSIELEIERFPFSPDRVYFKPPSAKKKKPPKQLFFPYDAESKKGKTEFFEFIVTREEILDRLGVKRPISQKEVMNHYSALEIMTSIATLLSEKQNGRDFHLAHRRGWSMGGDQSYDNLDPMTAGANLETLFKVEGPIKRLLMDQSLPFVLVKGNIVFDDSFGLASKVNYQLSWGTEKSVEVVIDPLSHRIPTEEEHEVVTDFIRRTIVVN